MNMVILQGRLGADPETRTSQSGTVVTSVRLATDRARKQKDGSYETETEWHRVTFWGRSAENVARYFKRGSGILVKGELHTSKWQDDKGNDRWTTEVWAHQWEFPPGSIRSGRDSREGGNAPEGVDDDIPF